MKAALVVMAFQARRQVLVPVAGLLLGCAGALAPFGVQSAEMFTRANAQVAVVLSLLTLAPAVMARTTRGSVPDFFFVHPLPWWAVWAGRVAAHVVVAGALLAAVSLPYWWRHQVNVLSQFWEMGGRPERAFELVFIFVTLVGVSTVVFSLFAARSTRATAMCGASVAMGTWALVTTGGVFARGELPTAGPVKWLQLAAFVLPVLLFTTVYLAQGRGDGRRGSRRPGSRTTRSCGSCSTGPGCAPRPRR